MEVRRRRIRDLVLRLLLAFLFVVGLWYVLWSAPAYTAVLLVPYAGVGNFLVLRRPRNVIGWTLLGIGWFWLLVAPPANLDYTALQAKSAGAFVETLAWGHTWIITAGFGLVFILTIVFPSGRLPGGAWGWFARSALIIIAAITVLSSFQPIAFTTGGAEGGIDIPNPLALFPEAPIWAILKGGPQLVLVTLLMVAGLVSTLVRYRRSRGLERQQLRWVVSSFAFVLGATLFGYGAFAIGGPGAETFGWTPAVIAFLMVPISIGIAVMRYRLYEIDRIVSRTLAYAALTATLVVVYLVGFLGLQSVLSEFTANGGSIAVAASTLAVFALFQPVRRRIQAAVDRRFNRSRYDAAREIDGFASRVRDEVQVERLTVALATTLERTMQPASASVWLRGR